RAALQANPSHPDYREFLRNDYATLADVLLDLGDHAGAGAAAEEMPRLYPERPEEYLRAADYLALCTSLARSDGRLPEGQRRELGEKYARRAVELLREAVRHGFKDVKELKAAPVYEELHDREDFQELLRDLEAATKSAIG